MNVLHCKCKSVCKVETPTCHVARQEGHGWALALNRTPNRRPRFYAVKLYSSLLKCILHCIAPLQMFHTPSFSCAFCLGNDIKALWGLLDSGGGETFDSYKADHTVSVSLTKNKTK